MVKVLVSALKVLVFALKVYVFALKVLLFTLKGVEWESLWREELGLESKQTKNYA